MTDEVQGRFPCYCLPGAARCDDPYRWCDRAEHVCTCDDVDGPTVCNWCRGRA